MSIFRFARIIEDRGRQYLLRAANNAYLVGNGQQPGPTTALTIDTWITAADGYDWETMRFVLNLPNAVAMLQALECFTVQHARDAYYHLAAFRAQQLTREEQVEIQQTMCESVGRAIIQRYGSMG